MYVVFLLIFQCLWGDPLPSWSEGPNKLAILQLVEESKNLLDHEKIAVFDQDGTLWVEKPYYTQLVYALENASDKSSMDPLKLTEGEIAELIVKTHAGQSIQAFDQKVANWLSSALHPRFKRHYTELIYQPMLEVMRYLEKNGFNNYIVSGGGQEFIRVYSDKVYQIPVNRVIGTAGKVKYQEGQVFKEKEILFINDKAGKVEGINLIIGKRPWIAFGNSDGDKEMLEWSIKGKFLVHHDDPLREYAYDNDSTIGRLSHELMEEAKKRNWRLISMKEDWKIIFP